MNDSKQEEVLAGIYAACAILCFAFGFTTWGWIFAVKAALDTVASIYFAVTEIAAKGKT